MKLSFSKTLLSMAILVGLTACGSGGGSASSQSTTDASSEIKIPTIKVDIEKLSGTASYLGRFDSNRSGVLSQVRDDAFARGGQFRLNADFDQKTVSGTGKLYLSAGRYESYRQIANGANLVFEETALYRDSDGDLAFKGKATGVVQDILDATYNGASNPYKVNGKYEGYFHGNAADNVELSFDVISPKDSRVGAFGSGSGKKQ